MLIDLAAVAALVLGFLEAFRAVRVLAFGG